MDLDRDGNKAESLLEWADTLNLAPYTTTMPTSLRADRKIDFALSNQQIDDIHAHMGNTTSDHRPVISTLYSRVSKQSKGTSVHWKVYSLFSEYALDYWERR